MVNVSGMFHLVCEMSPVRVALLQIMPEGD